MGISPNIAEIEKQVLKKLNLDYKNLKLCELGNQYWGNGPAKIKYEEMGVNHISLDINGDDGSIALNLDEPVPNEMIEQFDVITNYGTLEHVNNQYQGFKNAYELCKKNGIIINALPKKGDWPNHCRYYYEENFFVKLAELCNCEVIFIKTEPCYPDKRPGFDLIHTVFRKKEDSFFPSREEFEKLNIFDSGDLDQTGNYTKK